MSGIHVSLDILMKVRADLDELANKLEAQVRLTDNSIAEASRSWNDVKFAEFQAQFEKDKELIFPLISDVREFNDGFLQDTINRLHNYLR